jgi:hypothetical protein
VSFLFHVARARFLIAQRLIINADAARDGTYIIGPVWSLTTFGSGLPFVCKFIQISIYTSDESAASLPDMRNWRREAQTNIPRLLYSSYKWAFSYSKVNFTWWSHFVDIYVKYKVKIGSKDQEVLLF